MGCILSSAPQHAETDEPKGGRTSPDGPNEKTKLKPRKSLGGTMATRRRLFVGSRISEGAQEVQKPKKVSKSESDRTRLRKALCEGTLLGALSTFELEEMIDYMDTVNLRQGQEYDLGGSLCVVIEGEVKTSVSMSPSARPDSSRRFTSGMVFGQVGLFDDSNTAGDLLACATRATKICKLPGSAYRQGMEFSRQAQIKANMKLLTTIPIFDKLSVTERLQISDVSEVRTYQVNEPIIQEGDPGAHFYIIRSGGAAVTRGLDEAGKPKRIDYKYPGDYFGEAALLDNQPRNATVVAAEPSTDVLCVGKALFDDKLLGPLSIIMERGERTLQQHMLVSVPLLAQLTAEARDNLIGRLKHESFDKGTHIFKQGETGDRLYIIKAGTVSVQLEQSKGVVVEIDHLVNGQYFGERALIKEEPRMASTMASSKLECYTLSKHDFVEIGIEGDVAWSRRWDEEDTRDVLQLQCLRSLGAGAFGTAWLVKHRKTGREYALKSLDKHTVKRQNWTSVVMREKDILASLTPHPCVITMHNAFQSTAQLFMLMEIAQGGELFQLLEKFHRFEPRYARFYAGCVTLAIGHLHKHGVIFRDLKPENLLLTSSGYLKLIDMGFAKRLGKGEKTYTLCGTPYYLAPEMILHRGHGFALDWWTVGVLTYEMLEGEPPFTGNSEMEVYSKVTRLSYSCPPRFPEAAIDIVSQLLRKEPETRLGNLRHGTDDVMAHPYFHGFSWDDLLTSRMVAPYQPTSSSSNASSHSTSKKTIDLSDSVTSPNDVGFWPGW